MRPTSRRAATGRAAAHRSSRKRQSPTDTRPPSRRRSTRDGSQRSRGPTGGWQHTLELNLARLREGLAETELAAAQQELLRERLGALANALEQAPKSRAWRMRARIGERRRWYEEPEEIAR